MGESLIEVVYLDGTESVVRNDVLDVLIATQKIIRFKRTDGWVDIIHQKAKLRDYRNREKYSGKERRSPWPVKK